MKVLRFLLVGFATVVVLALIAGGVVYTSWFQTWAVQKELALHPRHHVSLDRFDASWNRVRIEQLRIAEGGLTLSIPLVEAELPLLAATRRSIQIKKLVAKGWTIDLTQPVELATNRQEPKINSARAANFSLLSSAIASNPATAVPTIFNGVVNQLKLPVDLALDDVELEGEIILPPVPGQPPGRLKVSITGGNLGAGREGKFLFTSSTTLPPAAPVSDVNASGTIVAAMDTPRTFSRLDAHVDAEARGAQVPQGTRLALVVTAAQANAGESYTLVIDTAGRRLLGVQADYPAAATQSSGIRQLSGAWTLDVGSADLAPFTLGRALPQFSAQGAGRFEVDPSLTAFSASGRLDASGDQLGTLRPELTSLGAVKLTVNFDLVQTGSAIRVAGFAAQLSGTHPVFDLRALQPFEFNAKSGELKVAEPSKDLLSVDLNGLPLAWAWPLLKGYSVTGDDVQGAFLVGARNGGFAVRAAAPLVFGNLAISQAAKALVRDVAVSLEVSFDYSPQGWQAEVAPTSIRSGGITLATFAAKAGQLAETNQPIKLAGQWSANLPGVLAQPGAARFAVLTGGRAAGDFTASLGARRELQTKLTVSELTIDSKVAAVTLPALTVDLRADLDPNGKTTLSAPLVLERDGRKSDITFVGTVAPNSTGLMVDGRVTSAFLAAEDAQLLGFPFARMAGAIPAAMPEAGESPPVSPRDSAPAWKGIEGRFTLALKKVSYQQKFELTDVSGNLLLEPRTLKLEGVHAALGEGGELKVGAAVTFDGKNRDPYVLGADLTVSDFDPVPLFRAIDPTKPPTIEGKFTAHSHLVGTGSTFPQLVDHAGGEIRLTSKSGVFRGLQSDVADKVQKTTGTAAAIGGLLTAVKEKISDYTNRAQVVADIAKRLSEIPFDQLSVSVTRDADLNFNLKDFTLISPEVRLTGTGEIHYGEGAPILAQSLELRLQLGARGKLGDLMSRASLLDGRQDNLGYSGFVVPFRVTGTLEKPDTSEIKAALLKAAGGSLFELPWR
jgi:hypothetical protein